MTSVTVRVPAKVNLQLSVGPVRPDGFHELATVFQAVSLVDEIVARSRDTAGVGLTVSGEGEGTLPLDERNLAYRAAALLAAHAGTDKKVVRDPSPPPQDRITRAAWFVREHNEVRAATWALPAVKSAAHCAACHTRADQGEFRERDIRIPR